jgi:transglutaminase-like putative cysteine protease
MSTPDQHHLTGATAAYFFDYTQARANRTAREALRERTGVCRDYVRLAITLYRCMNIPARCCSGYLGDIGVPLAPYPMDFGAWFAAFLSGQWYAFDPRNNMPRIGRILMARGRRPHHDLRRESTRVVHRLR